MCAAELTGNYSKRILYLLFVVFLGFTVFGVSINTLLNSGDENGVTLVDLNTLSYVSLLLFLLVTVLGMISDVLYFTFLIFVVFAFPAPVNDFFPGFYLGDSREFGAAVFPFFTHVDIYLLVGIFKGTILNYRILITTSTKFLVLLACLFSSLAINFLKDSTTQETLLLVQGTYQFRYLTELFLLLSFYDFKKFQNNVLIGMVFSLCFLLIEAAAFTYKTRPPALASGSLANNTFASITAAILLFLIIIRRNYSFSRLYRMMLNMAIVVSVIIVIATGARMAVLAFIVTFFMYAYVRDSKRSSFRKNLYWFLAVSSFVVVIIISASYLPKRYNPKTITDSIQVKELSLDLRKSLKIEKSWETSSLITRLQLYATSIKMFAEHPFEGIGPGRWNLLKKDFGFREFILIDSHNGYLSVLSQYGLLGLPLIYFIYFFPLIQVYRQRNNENLPFIFFLAIINIYISFADLSNSSIFKHQVFAFLAFNSICVLKISKSVSTPLQLRRNDGNDL